MRRQGEDVGGAQQIRHILAVAEETDVGRRRGEAHLSGMIAGQPFAGGPQNSVLTGHRREQFRIAFFRHHATGHHDHDRILGCIQLGAQAAPRRAAVYRRCKARRIDAVADGFDHAAATEAEAARALGVFFGLGKENIRMSPAPFFQGDEERALPRRHVLMKIKSVRGIDDAPNTCAPRRKAAQQGGDRRVHMH